MSRPFVIFIGCVFGVVLCLEIWELYRLKHVSAQEQLPSPVYMRGLESAAPATCPAGKLAFFVATDTSHLFWCYGPSGWRLVGSVLNQPKPAGPAAAMGALVKGACEAYGTGAHVEGVGVMNEVQGNCVLPGPGSAGRSAR